jgi:hypothetical protein
MLLFVTVSQRRIPDELYSTALLVIKWNADYKRRLREQGNCLILLSYQIVNRWKH